MTIETAGLASLSAELTKAPAAVFRDVAAAVRINANRVKKDWRQRDTGLRHAPAYPYSITYDTRVGAGWVEAEIGPDKGRSQGSLGNLIEFGSVNNPPRGSGAAALQAQISDLRRGIELATRAGL